MGVEDVNKPLFLVGVVLMGVVHRSMMINVILMQCQFTEFTTKITKMMIWTECTHQSHNKPRVQLI